jgi:hypothetical protein
MKTGYHYDPTSINKARAKYDTTASICDCIYTDNAVVRTIDTTPYQTLSTNIYHITTNIRILTTGKTNTIHRQKITTEKFHAPNDEGRGGCFDKLSNHSDPGQHNNKRRSNATDKEGRGGNGRDNYGKGCYTCIGDSSLYARNDEYSNATDKEGRFGKLSDPGDRSDTGNHREHSRHANFIRKTNLKMNNEKTK